MAVVQDDAAAAAVEPGSATTTTVQSAVTASAQLDAEQLAPGMAPRACSNCSISLSYLVGRTGFEPVTSSVSGLLRDSAHLHQARSRCSRPLPRVAVITLDRPPDRARDGHAHGSGGGGSHLSNLRILPAWIRLLISPAANVISRIFRIMETFVATARTLQGMARVRSGCTCMEAAWIVRFSAWSS
jgi:hypothetical protein